MTYKDNVDAAATQWNKESKEQSLDGVLNEYVASTGYPNREALSVWVLLYPQYTKDLIDFIVSIGSHRFHEMPGNSEIDEQTVIQRGMESIKAIKGEL